MAKLKSMRRPWNAILRLYGISNKRVKYMVKRDN